jgi:hypothetical protein
LPTPAAAIMNTNALRNRTGNDVPKEVDTLTYPKIQYRIRKRLRALWILAAPRASLFMKSDMRLPDHCNT